MLEHQLHLALHPVLRSHFMCSYQLYCFLASQMLNVETDSQHTTEAVLQFLLQGFFLIRIVTVAEDFGDGWFLFLILHDVNSANSNALRT